MKLKTKSKIKIIFILGIVFALLPIITINDSFITSNSNNSSEISDNDAIISATGGIGATIITVGILRKRKLTKKLIFLREYI